MRLDCIRIEQNRLDRQNDRLDPIRLEQNRIDQIDILDQIRLVQNRIDQIHRQIRLVQIRIDQIHRQIRLAQNRLGRQIDNTIHIHIHILQIYWVACRCHVRSSQPQILTPSALPRRCRFTWASILTQRICQDGSKMGGMMVSSG